MTNKEYTIMMNQLQQELVGFNMHEPTTETVVTRKGNGFRKFAVGLAMAATLISIPVSAQAKEIITSQNSKMVQGTLIKKKHLPCGCYDIEAVITSKGKWNGHIYGMYLSDQEMKNWKAEEDKISKGMSVEMLMYTNGTKIVYDDEIINIHKAK